jgi:AcrR family transcriptional regulator
VRKIGEPEHRIGPFAPRHSPARARLRAATVELVVEHGFDGVDVEALCRRAGFDRTEFERDFDGVRDCAMRVYLANIDEFDRVLAAAADPADPWRLRLRTTAYATARFVRDHPLSTRFDMLAMLSAGEIAQAHRDRYVRRIVDLIDEGRQELPDPAALGRATAEGVFGSIYQLLARELVGKGRTGGAVEVVPQLMYTAVRPYLGDEAAREELTIPPPPERPLADRASQR